MVQSKHLSRLTLLPLFSLYWCLLRVLIFEIKLMLLDLLVFSRTEIFFVHRGIDCILICWSGFWAQLWSQFTGYCFLLWEWIYVSWWFMVDISFFLSFTREKELDIWVVWLLLLFGILWEVSFLFYWR